MSERTDLTEVQRNLSIEMENFSKEINAFKKHLKNLLIYVDSNPQIFSSRDKIPEGYKSFSDNMVNYEYSEKKFLRSWDKETMKKMIHYLRVSYGNLNDVIVSLWGYKKKTKLKTIDKLLMRKTPIHKWCELVDKLMKIIREYFEYLETIQIPTEKKKPSILDK